MTQLIIGRRDALVKLGLPVTADSDKYYINNMLIKGNTPFFCDDNSVDELNYLARLISNFDEEQTKKFIAAVDYKNFESVADVINIAHNTDYYSIMPDVKNWRDVGKVMEERAGFSKAQIEMFGDYFNFAQYAKSLENDKGKRILQRKKISMRRHMNRRSMDDDLLLDVIREFLQCDCKKL